MMKHIIGKNASAIIFTDNVDEQTIAQVKTICDQPFAKGSEIRVMPDAHAGSGCVIGTTMTYEDKICPNIVGVDIGCGVLAVKLNLSRNDIDFEKLDLVIRQFVPSGINVHNINENNYMYQYWKNVATPILSHIKVPINEEKGMTSVGTLGAGNHFISLEESTLDGRVWLLIHTGSRHVGAQTAEHYQKLAFKNLSSTRPERERVIKKLKELGRQREIESTLKTLAKFKYADRELAYLEGDNMNNYLQDMEHVQQYAEINRLAIAGIIIDTMRWWSSLTNNNVHSIHNYVDTTHKIIRKGSIEAQAGQEVVIPFNMRDGSIIAIGKGNSLYNFSAPHGAGRVMSRSKARQNLDLNDFKKAMKGIFTTTVSELTLDEAPAVYKPYNQIIEDTKETLEIMERLIPIYNFKAEEEPKPWEKLK
jgi:tRNA-splicing ligase RtcB